MKSKFFYNLEYATLTFFLINSFFINVGLNTITSISNNDSIIDIIIGGIFITSFLILFLWLKSKYKKNIIDIIKTFKIIKYPLLIILLIALTISSIYSLNTLTSFIHYYILKEVNILIISISLILISLYLVSKNIKTITRVSEICFYIYIFILFLGFIGLIKYIDINNIKPLFTSSINTHIKASFNFFNYSITPIFLLLCIDNNNYKKEDNRIIIIFTILSILIILLQLILILSVLGIDLTNIYNNPDIMIYKKISFLNIFERVEVFLSFNQLLNGLFILTINFYLIYKIIIEFIKKKKEKLILSLLGILFIFLCNTISLTKNSYLLVNNIFIIISIFLLVTYIFTSPTIRN